METLFIPNENDFKRWIKDAVKEFFHETVVPEMKTKRTKTFFLTAKRLQIF